MIHFSKAWILFGCALLQLEVPSISFADGLELEHANLAHTNEPAIPMEQLTTGQFTIEAAEKRIAASVEYLASDELQGRGLGKSGLTTAAHYIANTFASSGLRTDLWEGMPYQKFYVDNMTMISSTANNSLVLRDVSGKETNLQLGKDFQPMAVGGNGDFEGHLVFVGYGITAEVGGITYDDYLGVDVKDKVVLILRKEPQQADSNSPFNGTQKTDHALFSTKIANAKLHGAKAILFVNDFVSANVGVPNSPDVNSLPAYDAAGKPHPFTRLPVAFITRAVADQLIRAISDQQGMGLIDLEHKIDASLQPQSFTMDSVLATGTIELSQQKLMTANVVGIQAGAGALANESVVIGAHYDHVGMGEYGSLAGGVYEIHNGADDNASGTSALLELARRFTASRQNEQAPEYRKIVFIAFSGEERGLLGSKYYVRHPAHDLKQTAAMINLDMIGRLGSNRIIVYGVGSSPDFSDLVSRMATAEGLSADLQRPAMGPSDHQPFFEAGIPVLHFFTGIHPQYHRPSDDFAKINTTGIARITDMVYQVIDELAGRDTLPAFSQVSGRANIQIPSQEHGALGIQLRGDQEIPIVSSILSGGAAERSGLQVNDQIVAINNKRVDGVSNMLTEMQALVPKEEIKVTVMRNEEKLEIPVILGHY